MKGRITGFTAIFMLVATGVFAQLAEGISFGAWGRGVFSPLVVFSDELDKDGKKVKDFLGNVYVGTGSTRPNYAFEQEMFLTGEYDYVGFQLGLAYDGEGFGGLGGSKTQTKYWYNDLGAAIWVKPFGNEWLKVTGGTFFDDTLRGKIGEVNDGWEEFVLPGAGYKDEIFTRFGGHEYIYGNLGFMLSSSPIEGLFIGARLNAPGLWGDKNSMDRARDVYRYIHVGAGYEISGIGHARIQYLGGYLGKYNTKKIQQYVDETGMEKFNGSDKTIKELTPDRGKPAILEAAFALTAVEGLLADIGFKVYFPVTMEGKILYPDTTGVDDYDFGYNKKSGGFAVSAGAQYNLGDFGFTGRADSTFGAYSRTSADDKSYGGQFDTPASFDLRLVPSYNLGFASVGLDFGFEMQGNWTNSNGKPRDPSKAESRWGIGAFIRKDFANGYFKGGVTYTSPINYEDKDTKIRTPDKMIQIPIIMEYSF